MILDPIMDMVIANGIANRGATLKTIWVPLKKPRKMLPLKSPNRAKNVSTRTDDLYLLFLDKWLNTISLLGLLIEYSKTLSKTVIKTAETSNGANE